MSLPQTFKIVYPALTSDGQARIEEVPLVQPGNNQVLVKIEFAPINPSDVVTMSGIAYFFDRNPYPCGHEGSGVVVAVGENLNTPFKVGDKVHVAELGTYGEYVLAETERISPIQGDLSLEDAASHYINPATVYMFYQKVEEGKHKTAIHTVGASAIGRMMIRYFKEKGIKLINIVRRDELVEELKAEGADYVLNSKSPTFDQDLKELAEKESATVAFDAIGNEFSNRVLSAQPNGSILYVYGVLEGIEVKNVNIMELFKGKQISGLLIFPYVEELKKKGVLPQFWNDVHKYLPTAFTSKILKVFKVSELKEALEYFNANSSKGKVLLTPN